MLLNEYNEERHLKNTYEQGKADGEKEGIEKGQRIGIPIGEFRQLYDSVRKKFSTSQTAAEAKSMIQEQSMETRKQYHIIISQKKSSVKSGGMRRNSCCCYGT